MNVAIIPARGGSKRIPRKNIREFFGKPMIAWSIEAALNSECFDRVIVSTDDDEIAEIAEKFGAEAPFRRPAILSDDYTATRPVINHSIEQIEILYGRPDYVCCIYATAPLLDSATIKAAYAELEKKDLDFVFSAGAFSYPIQRAFRKTPNGHPQRLWPETKHTRSQDLEECYHDAGQFYWGKRKAFLDNCDPISDRSLAYMLPTQNVQDIDTEDDWQRAEILMKVNLWRIGTK